MKSAGRLVNTVQISLLGSGIAGASTQPYSPLPLACSDDNARLKRKATTGASLSSLSPLIINLLGRALNLVLIITPLDAGNAPLQCW
jgi:hypothetical protein